MGYEGKCTYIFKCKRCGQEYTDHAIQDGGDSIRKVQQHWSDRDCECGGKFLLYASEVQYYDGTGTVHQDIPEYFNPSSIEYFDALTAHQDHDDMEVRERVERELQRLFPGGRPSPRR